MKKGELPNKLSDCLELAMKDLETVEKMPNVRINMAGWFAPVFLALSKIECEVCLVGSVILNTFKEDFSSFIRPDDYNFKTKNKLQAINYLRTGNIELALDSFGYKKLYLKNDEGNRIVYMQIARYHLNPKLFKKQMVGMVKLLRANKK